MTRVLGRRVVVVGAGIIGLSCADRLQRAGHDVLVCDPDPGGGATHAAAGMLAPAGEAWFGEEGLLRLGMASLDLWPDVAASLEERSGVEVDLRDTGTLLVAADRDDLAEVKRSCAVLESCGLGADLLDGRDVRAHEPRLAPGVTGGALLTADRLVDPRQVTRALVRLLGERVVRQPAATTDDGVVLGDGSRRSADVVVLATGAVGMRHVRPVRGEVIRVRTTDPPTRMIRARMHGDRVYLAPRSSGEVVIGATEEEHPAEDGRPAPTLGGVARLLENARALVPGLDTAELVDVVARDRPGTPDNAPIIGPVPSPGQTAHLVAAGHHRGGVLLAPLTAAVVQAYVEGTPVPEVARPFTANRFDGKAELTCS